MQALTKKRPTDETLTLQVRVHRTKLERFKRYIAEMEPELPEESRPWRDVVAEQFPGESIPASCLRGARGREGVTQRQLADVTGIPQRHISEMEHGKRPIGKENARKLAKALNTDYRVFL
ncbi:MAG: helix-turn-helix transcriptional regulator [Oryzomonas sp.]|jgi:DNA-binding XRE family transcriptional regulator